MKSKIITIIITVTLFLPFLWKGQLLKAQNVAITDDDTYTANTSSMLDVKSTTKGLLIPRLTTTQRIAIVTPATGLLVYDKTKDDFYFYNGLDWINLTSGIASNIWSKTNKKIYTTDDTYKLGIGTSTPFGKVEVKSDSTLGTNDPIFQVINNNGDTVFAVYQQGVRVNVEDEVGKASGSKGGFAVGGFSPAKGTFTNEFLRVTADSVRVYIAEGTASKASGSKGGFAVGGFSPAKTDFTDYFNIYGSTSATSINPSEARIFWYPLKEAFLAGKVLVESPDSIGLNSFSTGYESKAIGNYSQAFGFHARAKGNNSTAIGNYANAVSYNSFAFGDSAQAIGIGSYAFGSVGRNPGTGASTGVPTIASGNYSVALGLGAQADTIAAFAIGNEANAQAAFSMSLGYQSTAKGKFSIALGYKANAQGTNSTALGTRAQAMGLESIALGIDCYASEYASFAAGEATVASGQRSTALGSNTYASGNYATSLGALTSAGGYASLVAGESSSASGQASVCFGQMSLASGDFSFAAGYQSAATNFGSFAFGQICNAGGISSVSLGYETQASGNYSFASGYQTLATNTGAFSCGYLNNAGGIASVSLGYETEATGNYSFAFGKGIHNSGLNSVAWALNDQTGTTVIDNNVYVIMGGKVGIGTISPQYSLDITGGLNLNKGISTGIALSVNNTDVLTENATYYKWGNSGKLNYLANYLGIGTTAPARPLHVSGVAEPAARFRRTNDGTLIELYSGALIQGSISISGTTTSYNAFTGSHYANSPVDVEKGAILKLTGENTFLNNNPESEIIYGTDFSSEPNSSDILGAYLGKEDFNGDNSPSLVMAVGNGVMWVVDNGENLKIGDYLISSNVKGHAMRDNSEYEIANIIGRVAETVDWNTVTTVINGKKHKLIAVFFENFKLEHNENKIKNLEQRIESLENIIKQ